MARSPSNKQVDRQLRAYDLLDRKRRGETFAEIAQALGITIERARKELRRAYEGITQEPTEDARALDVARIEAIIQVLWPNAMQGHLPSIDRIYAGLQHRAKLKGLFAPLGRQLPPDEQLAALLGVDRTELPPVVSQVSLTQVNITTNNNQAASSVAPPIAIDVDAHPVP